MTPPLFWLRNVPDRANNQMLHIARADRLAADGGSDRLNRWWPFYVLDGPGFG